MTAFSKLDNLSNWYFNALFMKNHGDANLTDKTTICTERKLCSHNKEYAKTWGLPLRVMFIILCNRLVYLTHCSLLVLHLTLQYTY